MKFDNLFFRITFFILQGLLIQNSYAVDPVWHFLPADVNALHSKPADYQIAYGNDPLQFGELRLPSNGQAPYPVAIIIHGGCWVSKFADVHYSAAFADALRDVGVATWNIEYRREDNTGGGWPGTFQDVAEATDFLRTIAEKYSLDLTHVIAIGHSAGGHLALWLAARHQLPHTSVLYKSDPLPLQGVISLGGVPDLAAFREHGESICNSDVVGKLLNTPKGTVLNDKEASPSQLVPLGIPQILIYGENDQSTPAQLGYDYQQLAKSKGDNITVITVKDAAHHEYFVPNAVTWPTITSAVTTLFNIR